jgi:hypothetical protein
MRRLLLLFTILMWAGIKSQPPEKFLTRFGGDGDDIGYSAKSTLDGQYIVAGSSTSYFTNGLSDAYLVKVDSMGFPMWQKFIGGTGHDVAKSVIQLKDSGFVLVGHTNSIGKGGYDGYVVRTNKSGSLLWQRTFGGIDWDFANDIAETPDSNLIVVGSITGSVIGKTDAIIISYDWNGNENWSKVLGGIENDDLRSVIITNDGQIAAVGSTESGKDPKGNCYFVKLNINGDTIFTKEYGSVFADKGYDLVQKKDNDYLLSGAKRHIADGPERSWAIRVSPTGSFISDTTHYRSDGKNEGYVSVANSPTFTYVTAFLRNVPVQSLGQQGGIFAMYPSWYEYAINEFGDSEDETCYSVEPSSHGGFVIIGQTKSYNGVGTDVFFLKINDSVVVNYQNVVGQDELSSGVKLLIDERELKVLVNGSSSACNMRVQFFDLYGRCLVDELCECEGSCAVDISDWRGNMFLCRINLSTGEERKYKIVR